MFGLAGRHSEKPNRRERLVNINETKHNAKHLQRRNVREKLLGFWFLKPQIYLLKGVKTSNKTQETI